MLVPVLIFLLRRDLLVQMQRYVVLQIPVTPETPSPGVIFSSVAAAAVAATASAGKPEEFDPRRPRGQEVADEGQAEGGIGSLRTGVSASVGGGGCGSSGTVSSDTVSSGGHLAGRWARLASRTGGDGGVEVGGERGDSSTNTMSGSWGKVSGSFVGLSSDAREKKGLFEAPTLEPHEGERGLGGGEIRVAKTPWVCSSRWSKCGHLLRGFFIRSTWRCG